MTGCDTCDTVDGMLRRAWWGAVLVLWALHGRALAGPGPGMVIELFSEGLGLEARALRLELEGAEAKLFAREAAQAKALGISTKLAESSSIRGQLEATLSRYEAEAVLGQVHQSGEMLAITPRVRENLLRVAPDAVWVRAIADEATARKALQSGAPILAEDIESIRMIRRVDRERLVYLRRSEDLRGLRNEPIGTIHYESQIPRTPEQFQNVYGRELGPRDPQLEVFERAHKTLANHGARVSDSAKKLQDRLEALPPSDVVVIIGHSENGGIRLISKERLYLSELRKVRAKVVLVSCNTLRSVPQTHGVLMATDGAIRMKEAVRVVTAIAGAAPKHTHALMRIGAQAGGIVSVAGVTFLVINIGADDEEAPQ